MRPGKIPARNSFEIETCRSDAENDKADAGRNHRGDDAAGGDEAGGDRPSCGRRLRIIGTSSAARAAASAAAEPDSDARMQEARMVT